MTETAAPGHIVRYELKMRRIEVAVVERLTDRYVRVTFTGEDLADFQSADPDDHMKLLFPPDPETELVLPGPGFTYPEGAPRPATRDYTPRAFDPAKRELVVDFVIHGEGPASNWAAQARPGQTLGVGGPRGSWVLDATFDWYLLIGDETVLPSIARRLEELPAGAKVVAFIEVNGPEDELPLPTQADADVRWVHRGAAPAGTSDVLEQAIRAAAFPQGSVFVWAGGEASTLRGIRRYLKNEVGIPVANLRFSGHWKQGVANHDHHEPIEE